MTVTVIGLGAMGSRIAARLLDAGPEIVAWNQSEEKAKALVDRGAAIADSPAGAAARADATITMLTDPAALESVLADVPPDSTTLIQMSTVGPEAVARLRFRRLLMRRCSAASPRWSRERFDVLAATPLAQQAERRRAAIESGEYAPRFALSLARKDADLILEVAERAAVDLRLVPEARRWLVDTEAAGLGADDYAAVLVEIVSAAERGQQA
jgi:3-hydroxyisobutyrate dehydrogenase-like beta-hydroxyacid dehydrogenase